MLTKITKDTLSGLNASGKVQFVRDTKLIGFGVKVSEAGRATYIAEKRIKGGRVVRKTIGEVQLLTLDQAREEDRQDLGECDKVFEDKASAGTKDRQGLTDLIEWVREGDTVKVWSIDRLARVRTH